MSDSVCEECGLKPWDAQDLRSGDLRELEPDFILGPFMTISGDDYVPGSVDGEPWRIAVWLEYGRRGGVEPVELLTYRYWLPQMLPAPQVERVMAVADELARLTEAGDLEGLGAYLDGLMAAGSTRNS